jgi:Brp/Blh family beta-carotene 15,15'-monooxygenase
MVTSTGDARPPAGTGDDAADDGQGAAGVAAPDEALRRPLAATTTQPSAAALAVVALPFALGLVDGLPLWLRLAPLAASVVLLGLPHGAVDHLAPARTRGAPVTARSMLAVGAVYLLLGGAYAAAWWVAPAASAAGFVLLTWVHWGQGDVWPLAALSADDHPDGRGLRAATAAVRGGLPMLVPLLAFPDTYRRVLGWFVAPFGGSTAPLAPLFGTDARLALGAGFGALTVGTLAAGYRRSGGSGAWRVDAAETALLWAYFLVVPPVLSVGLYFCLWHALRHVGRLLAVDETAAAHLRAGRPARAFGRFARDAAPLTAVSLALLAALAAVVPVRPAAPGEWLGLYLAFVAVLTLPHVAVVALMDRVQGVWA